MSGRLLDRLRCAGEGQPRRRGTGSALALALVLAGAACSGGADDSASSGPSSTARPTTTAPQAPTRSTVFRAGEGGVDSFRIPGVGVTPRGTVVVAAEARDRSVVDEDPHRLVARRSPDGGRTWGPVTELAPIDEPEKGCFPSDPVVLAPSTGPARGDVLVVFRPCRSGGGLGMVRSTDDGRTWSDPTDLQVTLGGAVTEEAYDGLRAGPGSGIELTEGPTPGRLVIAADGGVDDLPHPVLALLYSDDGGRTWAVGANVAEDPSGLGPDETALTQRPDGSILVSSRGGSPARVQAEASADATRFVAGASGAALSLSKGLVSPGVASSLLTVPADGPVVFSSPSDPTTRRGLRLWTEPRDGVWKPGPIVEQGASAYSDMAMLDDRTIAVVVEAGERNPYERIDLVPVAVADLGRSTDRLGPAPDPADAINGRLVVDGHRYAVRSYCIGAPEVELDGGTVAVDLSGGFGAVKLAVHIDDSGDGTPLDLSGTVALDITGGAVYRGHLQDADGVPQEVDMVLANLAPCAAP